MKTYEILFGVMGNIILDVEAENDEQAHEAGWDALNELSDADVMEIMRDTYKNGNFDFDIVSVEEDE